MAESHIKTVLDVSRNCSPKVIIAKRLDINSRFLTAAICDGGKPICIPQSAAAVLNVRRSDGEKKAFSCCINPNGTVTAPLRPWMLEIAGACICDISVYGVDETKLSTTSFTVRVEANVLDPKDLEGDDNYSVLVDIIRNVQSLKGELESCEAAIAKTESERVRAESERAAAESNRQISFASAVRRTNIAADIANAAAAAAENVNITARQITNGMEVTITNRYGEEKNVQLELRIATEKEFRELLGDIFPN